MSKLSILIGVLLVFSVIVTLIFREYFKFIVRADIILIGLYFIIDGGKKLTNNE